ncbi:small ribosomal subunit protein mS31-like [Amphiura filiformis]|uniref:small ribosomal subunit protein mS31-like n=1 Tax=Amphiura filiformis TaxID=82378 RepID=UPI003B22360F
MNNLTRSQLLVRLLQKEIRYRAVSRTIQTSACLRTTKSSKEDGKLPEQKTDKDTPDVAESDTAKNLFDTLAGMKVSKTPAGARKKERIDARSSIQETSKFKTAEALKNAMSQAAKTVSKSFPDADKTESDLVKQLRRYEEAKAAGERGDTEAVSSLLTGLKVGNVQEETEEVNEMKTREGNDAGSVSSLLESMVSKEPYERLRRGQQRDMEGGKRRDMDTRRGMERAQRQRLGVERIQTSDRKLFVGRRLTKERLGIFKPSTTPDSEVTIDAELEIKSIWEQEEENELNQLRKMQMRHGFDEMIDMTREGRLWKYPIDNEQGLEEEQAVGFHEHVLLDDLIEDFPKTGPVRDFMELVIIALSKNAYFTVQQKKEHIDWFRNYFQDKEEALREAESLPKDFSFA